MKLIKQENLNDSDGYSIERAFGDWLRERRIRKSFSLEQACKETKISLQRLIDLEMGQTRLPINNFEIESISEAYGLDPRATARRRHTG
jgi:transcriptional regulator with XRE-family HTH domain